MKECSALTSKYALPYHQNMNLQEIFNLYEEKLRRVELNIKELFRNKIPFIPLDRQLYYLKRREKDEASFSSDQR